MKKIIIGSLVVLALCLQFSAAGAASLVWQGYIPGDGRQVGPINLNRGATYYIQVGGSMYFGRWYVNGRPLSNDPCYEFTARPQPVSLPILKNNLGINYCPGVYNSNHNYRSANFVSDGRALYFNIFDTDYRDNQGGLRAAVYLVSGGGGAGPGSKQGFCRNYANTAIAQNRENQRRGCGFTGGRWQNNFNNHYNWCMGAARSAARSENQARRDALNRCGSGKQSYCRSYANTAIAQNRENLRRGCGFTGSRWSSNFSHHYDWCMRASRNAADNGTRGRQNDLARCGGGGGGGKAGFCRDYAKRAVDQNNANLRRGCGYSGNRWQSNFNNHYNWCMQVSRASAKGEDQARINSLNRCGSSGNKAGFCRDYAKRAVEQNNANRSRGCGYSGNRWQSNFNNHYNWCMQASRGSAQSEDRARVDGLNRCGGSSGKRSFCQDYARRAVQQNQNNLSGGCGFTGTRWQSNFNNHYNWCMGVARGSAHGENNARRDALNRCRAGRQVVRFNNPRYSGLPWDWCLTWATNCGKPAADDFCRKQGYRESVKWGKQRFNATFVVRDQRKCTGSCGGFTYVDCRR